MNTTEPRLPNPIVSAIPIIVLISMIVLMLILLPKDALAGASQMSLIIASAVCVGISIICYKTPWKVFEDSMIKTVGDASVSIFILLLIGMMSSTWMISGVVPTLI